MPTVYPNYCSRWNRVTGMWEIWEIEPFRKVERVGPYRNNWEAEAIVTYIERYGLLPPHKEEESV